MAAPTVAQLQAFPCERCGALPGETCVTTRGQVNRPGVVTQPHISRYKQLWRSQGREW